MQISDKSILPVTKVYYGPLEFEMDQMKIVVGSLVCQPDPEKQNGIEDRIENIELQNNRTQDIMNNYSEKITYLEDRRKPGRPPGRPRSAPRRRGPSRGQR